MKLSSGIATIAALFAAQGVSAIPEWAQCAGNGWTGSGTCDAGLTCVYVNDWYSQCQKASTTIRTTTTSSRRSTSLSTPVSTTRTSTSISATPSSTGRVKFKYYGVNQSCAEFGHDSIPGVLGTHYTWPATSSIDVGYR
ncbi:hypothetical protein FRC02_001786 [Tulasnella sp. 418]|nr:hypothetical protein FRC02_001786 [Tulasnella sp. 418]